MKTQSLFLAVCLLATVFITAFFAATPTHAQMIFEDGFESGTMTSTTNGFRWGSLNRTSLVIQDPNDGPVLVYNSQNKSVYFPKSPTMSDGTPRDWTAFEGDHSLRFAYPPRSANVQPWAEQRFKLGGAYQEVWTSFMVRVPTNFSHVGLGNSKLFAIWMDGYSGAGDGATAFWNYWNDGTNGSQVSVTWTEGEYTSSVSQTQFVPFIDLATDKGRWMELVFKVKAATNRTSEDGTLDLWRRWDGETDYEHLQSLQNVDLPPSPDAGNVEGAGWSNGYLMGWANNGYAVETEWLLDNFKVSQTSLLTTLPNSLGDFDNDGDTDGNDFLFWQRDTNVGSLSDWEANFGASSAVAAATVVPEPSTLGFFMLGFASIAGCRRRVR